MFIFGISFFYDFIFTCVLLFCSILLVFLSEKASRRLKLLDYPDNSGLKLQKRPIPLAGGLLIFGSLLATLSLYSYFNPDKLLSLGAILMLLFFVMLSGIYDDLYHLKAEPKLILYWLFTGIFLYFFRHLLFVDIFYLLANVFLFAPGIITAINMIDGMDGLCAGLSIVSMIVFFIIGLLTSNSILTILSFAGLISLISFLLFNFHPAKIFLGNSGSQLIGFLFFILVTLSMSNLPVYFLPLRILLIGIPVLDMVRVMIVRYKNCQPIMQGDRNHFYDLLMAKNFSQRRVWIILILGQIFFVSLIYLVSTLFLNYFSA